MDMSGGVFCTLSLVFKESFDAVAGVRVPSPPSGSLPGGAVPVHPKCPHSSVALLLALLSSRQANYIGIVVLDGLILILACILNPRANRRRKREALETPCDTMDTAAPSPEMFDHAERGHDLGLASGVEKAEVVPDASSKTEPAATSVA